MQKIYEQKLGEIRDMVLDWESMFDETPPSFLDFTVDADGQLALNGIRLCPIVVVDVDRMFYGAEYICIPLANDSMIDIDIDWAYERDPEVGQICHSTYLYRKKSKDA